MSARAGPADIHLFAEGPIMILPPSRVLIAVHGFEPASWAADAARTISMWRCHELRLLIVPCAPAPPFTSLTPIARRAYADARTAWRLEEERRLERIVAECKRQLSGEVDVVRAPSLQGDLAATIASHAGEWPADVVVVGAPEPSFRAWLWPGPVHQRVVLRAPCAVLVLPAPAGPSLRLGVRRRGRGPSLRPMPAERRA
jgi:nucleotide-binding universal stress UspA family protein